jgi:MFS family permease
MLVLSQLAATSLWFAGNAVLPELLADIDAGSAALAWSTAAVQAGFILGALLAARWAVADRYPGRWLFAASACSGAGMNALMTVAPDLLSVLGLRFLVGLSLAGTYPVGMKLAAGWYRHGLGRALGYLVGALVLGTAAPHFVRALGADLSWRAVLLSVSGLAAAGGVLLWAAVPEPQRHATSTCATGWPLRSLLIAGPFRASACGYFGHMWEIYTFWTFVPVLLSTWSRWHGVALDVAWWSGVIIAVGSIGCVGGGIVARRASSTAVAGGMLLVSGGCCLALPILFESASPMFLGLLLLWGVAVAGDSPQLSALSASHAPSQQVGAALSLVTSIGFALTIASIQLTAVLADAISIQWSLMLLVVGPAFGLVAIRGFVAMRQLRSGPSTLAPRGSTDLGLDLYLEKASVGGD